MNTLYSMLSFIFPLLTYPYISRVLMPEGVGKITFASSIITYFNMISQLGLPIYGIRACAKVRDNKEELTRTVHELLLINFLMTLVTYIILGFALTFLSRMRNERTLYIILSSLIFLSAIGMEWLYKALEQYTYITIRSLAFKLIAFVGIFIFVRSSEDYLIYAILTIIASSAFNILNFIYARKFIRFTSVGHYNLKKHMKPIFIFFAMSCATTIYTNLDTVMLGFMKTDVDVGYYNAAVKIKIILVGLVTSLGTVLLPRLSYYVEQKKQEEFKKLSKKAMKFVFLIASPLMVYFILFAETCILFLSGDAFIDAVVPMKIIMPTILLIGITNVLGIQILVPLGKEIKVLLSVIVGGIIDVIFNLLFIPSFASSGAALGTLVAEFIVLIVQIFCLRSEIIDAIKIIPYLKIGIAILIGSLSSFWLIIFDIPYIIKIIISGCLFFGMYGLSLLVMREALVSEIFVQFFIKLHNFIKK